MVGFLRLQWTSDGGEREQHWCLSSSLLLQQDRICSRQQRIHSLQSSSSIRFLHFEYFLHVLRWILTSALSVGRVFQAFVLCRPTFSMAFCSGRAKPSRWCPMFLTSLERSACMLLERRVPSTPDHLLISRLANSWKSGNESNDRKPRMTTTVTSMQTMFWFQTNTFMDP